MIDVRPTIFPIQFVIATRRYIFISSLVLMGLLPMTAPAETSPHASPTAVDLKLPADFPECYLQQQSMQLTLPDGHRIVGKIETRTQSEGGCKITGAITHPSTGVFTLERRNAQPSAIFSGSIQLNGSPTEWHVQEIHGNYQFYPRQVTDAFRPKLSPLTQAAPMSQEQIRAQRQAKEATLKPSHAIQKISATSVRIGEVLIDSTTRTASFPIHCNLREALVEYALVTEKGKTHEALFTTAADPTDIHLAMLLLGVKVGSYQENQDHSLSYSPMMDLEILVEWEHDGTRHSRPLGELLENYQSPLSSSTWCYIGSKFNDAGFAANAEGSIIALGVDDLALINYPGTYRHDDKAFKPVSKQLPPASATPTMVLRPPTKPPQSFPKLPTD